MEEEREVLENDPATFSLIEDSLRATPSENILEEISPLPSSLNAKFISRKSLGLKSEILISTPQKAELERNNEEEEEKAGISGTKRKLLEENLLNKERKK